MDWGGGVSLDLLAPLPNVAMLNILLPVFLTVLLQVGAQPKLLGLPAPCSDHNSFNTVFTHMQALLVLG